MALSLKQLTCDRGFLLAVLAVLAWVFGGAVVYWLIGNCSTVARFLPSGKVDGDFDVCPWHFAHAFYFSVQTGLSIGFGLLSESKKISEWYSCFHILLGSSFIGGALSWFVSLMTTKQRDFLSQQEQQLIKASLALHADGYHGFTMPQLRDLMLMHPQYANDIIHKLYPSSSEARKHIWSFAHAGEAERMELANEHLREASARIDFFKHDNMNLEDLVELDNANAPLVRKLRKFYRQNTTFMRITAAFICWLSMGAIFSAVADENSFITSMYFAIATCSTAGMIKTTTVESDAHVWFVGVFALVGVPLYAAMLGSFADILVQRTLEKETQAKLNQDFSEAETAFLKHLAESDGDDEVNVAEYTLLQLLRLGMVDRDTLDTVAEQFKQFDAKGAGRVKIATFLHARHMEVIDGNVACDDGEGKRKHTVDPVSTVDPVRE